MTQSVPAWMDEPRYDFFSAKKLKAKLCNTVKLCKVKLLSVEIT